MFERAKERVAQKNAKAGAASAQPSPAPEGAPPNGLILYHYRASPVARRVVWYLTLRGLPYAECTQPPTKPRPDLESLPLNYRRIPVLALNRTLYLDSRLMLSKLESHFPPSATPNSFLHPVPQTREAAALIALLASWTMDGGVFARGAQLIPLNSPALRNESFVKDRESFSGRSWSTERMAQLRGENMVALHGAFAVVEGLLGDGRKWVLGTEGVTIADVEAIWVHDWLVDMKDALDASYISATSFPHTFAWIARFRDVLAAARAAGPTPLRIKGPAARAAILAAAPAEHDGPVDTQDPTGLRAGDLVQVYPTDSGFGYRDAGRLVKLTPDEVAIAVGAGNGDGQIRVHAPRGGFRVARAKTEGTEAGEGKPSKL